MINKRHKTIKKSNQKIDGKQGNRKDATNRTIYIILILVACILCIPIYPAIPFLLLPFALSDLSEPLVVLFNGIIVAVILTTFYQLKAKKATQQKRRALMVAAFFMSIIFVWSLSFVTVPAYQRIQVAVKPAKMAAHLEKRYGEEFMVENAKYKSVKILGDAKGVSATAYPKNNPTYKFVIYEDHGKVIRDNYYDLYSEKIEDDITKQLEADLVQFNEPLMVLESVSLLYLDYPPGQPMEKSISININEDFVSANWKHYEEIVDKTVELLNRKPYDSFAYFLSIGKGHDYIHDNSFYCDFSPKQRIGEMYLKRMNDCILSHNTFGKKNDQNFKAIER